MQECLQRPEHMDAFTITACVTKVTVSVVYLQHTSNYIQYNAHMVQYCTIQSNLVISNLITSIFHTISKFSR